MKDYKETKTIGRKSPLNELKMDELRELVAWENQDSYKILRDIIMQGELIYSRDALLEGKLEGVDFVKLSERFKTFRSILNIPNLAKKLLANGRQKRGKA